MLSVLAQGPEQLRWFVQGVWLPLALLLIAVVAGALLLVAWVAGRWLLWRRRVRRARRAAIAARIRADGSPYPPEDQGLCDRCSRSSDRILFLPDGRRLCRDCYDVVVPLKSVGERSSC